MLIKIILWVMGAILFLFGLLWLNAIRASWSRNRKLKRRIQPVLQAVKEGDARAPKLIWALAEEPATRNFLFGELREAGHAAAFPQEYRTLEKIAESDMVFWLMHGNELQVPPDEIELVRKVAVADGDRVGAFFLFRFRVGEPHWAADRDWMAGIAGPFFDHDDDIESARYTFSELEPYASKSDAEHLAFLRVAAKRAGLVIPS